MIGEFHHNRQQPRPLEPERKQIKLRKKLKITIKAKRNIKSECRRERGISKSYWLHHTYMNITYDPPNVVRTAKDFINIDFIFVLEVLQSVNRGLIGGEHWRLVAHHTEGKEAEQNRLNCQPNYPEIQTIPSRSATHPVWYILHNFPPFRKGKKHFIFRCMQS